MRISGSRTWLLRDWHCGTSGRSGPLSIGTIHAETEGLDNTVFFLSGPPVMIRLFSDVLAEKGVGKANIKSDDWE